MTASASTQLGTITIADTVFDVVAYASGFGVYASRIVLRRRGAPEEEFILKPRAPLGTGRFEARHSRTDRLLRLSDGTPLRFIALGDVVELQEPYPSRKS